MKMGPKRGMLEAQSQVSWIPQQLLGVQDIEVIIVNECKMKQKNAQRGLSVDSFATRYPANFSNGVNDWPPQDHASEDRQSSTRSPLSADI